MWADWCHTCLAMKKGPLADAGLSEVSNRFVWLAVDTEEPSSAAVMDSFPPKVWPTFFVVSPDETVQASLQGSASVKGFREFLQRGAQAHLQGLEGTLAEGTPLDHMRRGDQAWMGDAYQEAAGHFASARQAADKDWPLWASALKNEIAALHKLPNKAPCAELAAAHATRMAAEHNSSGVDFLYYGSDCASALADDEAKALLTNISEAVKGILEDDAAALSTDDRSDAMGMRRGVLLKLDQGEEAKELAKAQKALLASAVAAAQSPLEEMTYVWHQVEVHAFLEEGEAILPWVMELEAKLPLEYDPPYRLAWLYLSMGRYPEAHKAIARALPKTSGARHGSFLSLQAAIYNAEGNSAKEREVRTAVVTHFEGLEKGRANAKKLAKAQEALAAMSAP